MASLLIRIKNLLLRQANPQGQKAQKEAAQRPDGAQQQPLKQQSATLDGANGASVQAQAKATTSSTLKIALQNQSSSSTVYAYISASTVVFLPTVNLVNTQCSRPSHQQQ